MTLEERLRRDLLKKLKRHGFAWKQDDLKNPEPVGLRHLATFLDSLERRQNRKKHRRKPDRNDRVEIVARQKKFRGRYEVPNGN